MALALIEDLHENGMFEYGDNELKVLNAHARVFYGLLGYQVADGFDFSASAHRTEQTCFLMACYAKNAAEIGDFEI